MAGLESVDGTTVLGDDDFLDVLNAVASLAAKWEDLGLSLGLHPSDLENICSDYDSLSKCLKEMLKLWLRQSYDVCDCCCSGLLACLSKMDAFAVVTTAKASILQETNAGDFCGVKKFGKPTWRKLVEAVENKVGGNNPALARTIAGEHPGAPVPQRPASPTLQGVEISQITTHQESSSAAFFKHENLAAITAKFAKFQTKVCDWLVKNGVDIEFFRLFVKNQFPPGHCIPPAPAGLIEIFGAITHNGLWDFLHYSPLVKIVQTFGASNSEMESWAETYKKDLKSFRLLTKVENLIDADLDFATLPPQNKVKVDEANLDVVLPGERAKNDLHYYCPVEWKTEFVDHSLQYLAEVWEEFSCHYLGPKSPPTALLDRVCKGCFAITWLVPSYLIPALIKRAKTDTDFFQQRHIVGVTVGEECVYEKVVGESASLSAQLGSITSEQKRPQYHSSDQHGVERMEAPLLRYTGPLANEEYQEKFTNLYMSTDYEQMQKLSKQILDSENISTDIEVFALCWEALYEAVHKNFEDAERLLRIAWDKASPIECENGLLLQGRVLRHLAHFQYVQGHDDKALEYISSAKQRLLNAAPSSETAHALYTELRIKRRTLFSKHLPFSSELYMSLEKKYELLLEHAKYMEEYEEPVACNFLTLKASFHLRSDMITDELPPEECWPSPDDLRKAEECLTRYKVPNQINTHKARYYRTFCDFHIWKKQYPKAMDYLKEARKVYDQMKVKGNNSLQRVDQRLKLLKGNCRVDEMRKDATV